MTANFSPFLSLMRDHDKGVFNAKSRLPKISVWTKSISEYWKSNNNGIIPALVTYDFR